MDHEPPPPLPPLHPPTPPLCVDGCRVFPNQLSQPGLASPGRGLAGLPSRQAGRQAGRHLEVVQSSGAFLSALTLLAGSEPRERKIGIGWGQGPQDSHVLQPDVLAEQGQGKLPGLWLLVISPPPTRARLMWLIPSLSALPLPDPQGGSSTATAPCWVHPVSFC